jgi:hypothetical protein
MKEDLDGTAAVECSIKFDKYHRGLLASRPDRLGSIPLSTFTARIGTINPALFSATVNFIEELVEKDLLNMFTSRR